MNLPCPVCLTENRDIDGFDLISVMGLMKEYNWQEIWRRYLPRQAGSDSVSMYVAADRYFIEMHVQKMQRIILSEKFNTNPFFMQQVIQRIIASHDHDLLMNKIQQQGIDTGDNPISLSCSLGNTIIDLIVNRDERRSRKPPAPHGNTHIEMVENRPLDVYDLSSTLYLCQQNLTAAIYKRYQDPENQRDNDPSNHQVTIRTQVGDYEVCLDFRRVSTSSERTILPPGNASVLTIHQVIQRMNFMHSPTLILKELTDVGLSITLEQLHTEFTLRRYINNTALRLDFKRI
ncbi:MAG: hypothetical protein ACLP5H_04950 [Desulfomonilaceae bacterium]